jgi:uncharacterized membrane protein YphA (DoxX/SURF4 family)
MKKRPFYNLPGNIIIRLLVGLVFLSEGMQKLIFPDTDGTGRFMKIGIPHPQFFGPFVGATEIICGSLLVIGFLTRFGIHSFINSNTYSDLHYQNTHPPGKRLLGCRS